ncbi:MAG: acyl-CoA thioesterase [Paludibacter sp.]|nr:acyl-CoA thioesterase [Paludibacter sp.]
MMTNQSKNYSQKLELRVDWSDIDSFGHVNNLRMMRYAQSGRVEYLSRIGLMQMHETEQKGPILAAISSQFLKPLFFPDRVTVFSKVEGIKNTSFKLLHEIYNSRTELVAKVEDVIVFYDFRKGEKQYLPDKIRKKIQQIEEAK